VCKTKLQRGLRRWFAVVQKEVCSQRQSFRKLGRLVRARLLRPKWVKWAKGTASKQVPPDTAEVVLRVRFVVAFFSWKRRAK